MRDARSLSDDALETLRERAVAMVAAGATQAAAAQALGVHKNTVSLWLKAWRAAGAGALKAKKRGRRPGEQKRLSTPQEAAIQKLIRDRCPDQLKLPFALWTRAAVRALIATRLGIALALTTVGDYLRRWGFTPQRPVKRALERQDAKIRAWLERDYPKIAARAKAAGAAIHWGDETGISNQANPCGAVGTPHPTSGRSFAPQGQTPVVARTAKRHTTSMISSVTNRGTTRFMLYDGALNVALFVTFLKRLTRDATRKIFLIVDNLKVHHAKKVKTWVAANQAKIELFFLPPYAPEHNPDELLNSAVKRNLAQRPAPRHHDALKASLRAHMRQLQRTPATIRAFFRSPTTAYAA
ncbi:MAG: IS630 family transposase [Burkholderiales bacterium]